MTKTKSEFLAAEEVQEMVTWLRARFRNGFRHSYAERKTHETWTCDGLFEAFRKYRWPKADWLANKSKLDGYRRRVRSAMAKCDDDELFNVCEKVLKWGWVWPKNHIYLEERRAALRNELLCLSKVLSSDQEPTQPVLRDLNDTKSECRMNAGFVKIYSVAARSLCHLRWSSRRRAWAAGAKILRGIRSARSA